MAAAGLSQIRGAVADGGADRRAAERPSRPRKEADAHYRPWLQSWAAWLHGGGKPEQATKVLDAAVTDPRAVPSIRTVFARKDPDCRRWPCGCSTGSTPTNRPWASPPWPWTAPKVRTWAIESLDGRDPRSLRRLPDQPHPRADPLRSPARDHVRRPGRAVGRGEGGDRRSRLRPPRVPLAADGLDHVRKLDSSGIWRLYDRDAPTWVPIPDPRPRVSRPSRSV